MSRVALATGFAADQRLVAPSQAAPAFFPSSPHCKPGSCLQIRSSLCNLAQGVLTQLPNPAQHELNVGSGPTVLGSNLSSPAYCLGGWDEAGMAYSKPTVRATDFCCLSFPRPPYYD